MGNAEELPVLMKAFTLEPGTTFPIKVQHITGQPDKLYTNLWTLK